MKQRFHIVEECTCYYKISNGTLLFHIWEDREVAQQLCDYINELEDKLGCQKIVNRSLEEHIIHKGGFYKSKAESLEEELQHYKSENASLEEELKSLRKRLERYEPNEFYMGERFHYGIFDDGTEYIQDGKTKNHYFGLDDVEELLNRLSGENIRLKEELEKSDVAFRCLLLFILKAPKDDVEEIVRQIKAFSEEVEKISTETLKKWLKQHEEENDE